jgi:hypothetical protein
MLFHASIAARDPAHVAAVVAQLWNGRALPFPPFPGSHVAIAGDDRGTALEVYPAGQVLTPGGDEVTSARPSEDAQPSATHLAVGVPLSEAEIQAIAAREGWLCRTCSRGGFFRVVEFWLENRVLLELLTPEMQREYRAFATPENWEKVTRMFTEVPPSGREPVAS